LQADLVRRRPNRRAADSKTSGLGLQRRRAGEENMSNAFEDDFEEMANPSTQAPATPIEYKLEDFVSYAPNRMCIYLPCTDPWPNASVDERIPPQPLLDANGNPIKNAQGKVGMVKASARLPR